MNNPSELKESYLIAKLQTLVNKNTHLVIQIGKILFKKKPEFFSKFLKQFVEKIDLSLASLEIIYRLVKSCKVEQEFLDVYIKNWLEFCKKEEGQNQTQYVQLICRLVNELMEEKLFDPSSSLEIWISFCSHFKTDKFVAGMHKMIEQTLKARDQK